MRCAAIARNSYFAQQSLRVSRVILMMQEILWRYFENVFAWQKRIFGDYDKTMQGVEWGCCITPIRMIILILAMSELRFSRLWITSRSRISVAYTNMLLPARRKSLIFERLMSRRSVRNTLSRTANALSAVSHSTSLRWKQISYQTVDRWRQDDNRELPDAVSRVQQKEVE